MRRFEEYVPRDVTLDVAPERSSKTPAFMTGRQHMVRACERVCAFE